MIVEPAAMVPDQQVRANALAGTEKIASVIASCILPEQVYAARRYARLYIKSLVSSGLDSFVGIFLYETMLDLAQVREDQLLKVLEAVDSPRPQRGEPQA